MSPGSLHRRGSGRPGAGRRESYIYHRAFRIPHGRPSEHFSAPGWGSDRLFLVLGGPPNEIHHHLTDPRRRFPPMTFLLCSAYKWRGYVEPELWAAIIGGLFLVLAALVSNSGGSFAGLLRRSREASGVWIGTGGLHSGEKFPPEVISPPYRFVLRLRQLGVRLWGTAEIDSKVDGRHYEFSASGEIHQNLYVSLIIKSKAGTTIDLATLFLYYYPVGDRLWGYGIASTFQEDLPPMGVMVYDLKRQ